MSSSSTSLPRASRSDPISVALRKSPSRLPSLILERASSDSALRRSPRNASPRTSSSLSSSAAGRTTFFEHIIDQFLDRHYEPTVDNMIALRDGARDLRDRLGYDYLDSPPEFVCWQDKNIRVKTAAADTRAIYHALQEAIAGHRNRLAWAIQAALESAGRDKSNRLDVLVSHIGHKYFTLYELPVVGNVEHSHGIHLKLIRELASGAYAKALEVKLKGESQTQVLLVGFKVDEYPVAPEPWKGDQIEKIIKVWEVSNQFRGFPCISQMFVLRHYDIAADSDYGLPTYAFLQPKLKPLGQYKEGKSEQFCKDLHEIVLEMHQSGIFHGDITTANVMKGSGQRPYLIDIDAETIVLSEAVMAMEPEEFVKYITEAFKDERKTAVYIDPNYDDRMGELIKRVSDAEYASIRQLKLEFLELRRARDIYGLNCVVFEITTGWKLKRFIVDVEDPNGLFLDYKRIRSAIESCPRFDDELAGMLAQFPPQELLGLSDAN